MPKFVHIIPAAISDFHKKRFWARVDVRGASECWLWIGGKNTNGYGAVKINRVQLAAHRVAYTIMVGPIPDQLTIDHLCRNRLCQNPEHLEAVTHRENCLRAVPYRKNMKDRTHCNHGHSLKIHGYHKKRGHWNHFACRLCSKLSKKNYRQRKKLNQ